MVSVPEDPLTVSNPPLTTATSRRTAVLSTTDLAPLFPLKTTEIGKLKTGVLYECVPRTLNEPSEFLTMMPLVSAVLPSPQLMIADQSVARPPESESVNFATVMLGAFAPESASGFTALALAGLSPTPMVIGCTSYAWSLPLRVVAPRCAAARNRTTGPV